MYGNQLNIEVVQRGLLDLPAEIIQQINHNLPLQDEKRFREVCLGSPILRKGGFMPSVTLLEVMVTDLAQNLVCCRSLPYKSTRKIFFVWTP